MYTSPIRYSKAYSQQQSSNGILAGISPRDLVYIDEFTFYTESVSM